MSYFAITSPQALSESITTSFSTDSTNFVSTFTQTATVERAPLQFQLGFGAYF